MPSVESGEVYCNWNVLSITELKDTMRRVVEDRQFARARVNQMEEYFDHLVLTMAARMGRLSDAAVDLGNLPKFRE